VESKQLHDCCPILPRVSLKTYNKCYQEKDKAFEAIPCCMLKNSMEMYQFFKDGLFEAEVAKKTIQSWTKDGSSVKDEVIDEVIRDCKTAGKG
jgi:hypothetical protein